MLIVILLLALTGNQLCFAKTVSPTYATSYDYVVRSGDVLEIAVWGHQDLSGIVTVNEDGRISLTGFLEEINILGLTIPEVQATLTDMLAYYLKNPKVTVTLREAKMMRITVIGCVRSPGVYSFRRRPTLIEVLASAGGYISEADLTCVRITGIATPASDDDIKSDSIIVDMNKVLAGEGETESEYYSVLQDGDIVYVPEKIRTVSVLGEVQRPGVYTVETSGAGTKVFDVIAAAGGPGINADTGCIRVTRHLEQGTHTIEIDMDTLRTAESESSGHSEQYDGSFKLVPGDVIYVPRAISVQVLGQVRNPGNYQLKAKSTFVHAIAQAGGTLDSADTTCISLHRGRGEEAGVLVLDLDAALSGRLPREESILKDQDTIIVPELVREISVLGAVNRPGVYKAHRDARILQVLAMAGGIAQDGDGASAVLTRKLRSGETERVQINLEELQSAAGESENYPVYNGDIIYVPQAVTVMVLGQVKAPGTYALGSTGRLMDAISRAGGILPDGDQTSVTLTRNGNGLQEVREIDIKAVMAGVRELNISLLDEDIIFVPDLVREVSVLGEVVRPGVYKIRDDTILLECLAQAGGITEIGDTGAVQITRHNQDGIPTKHTINTDHIHLGDNIGVRPMANGDIIYVPRAIAVQVLGEVAQPGLYRMKAGSCLSDAVAIAGGFKDNADGTQVVITSRTSPVNMTEADTINDTHGNTSTNTCVIGAVRTVDITRVLMGSNLSDNIALANLDTVFVPKLNREVVVVGEVVRPGLYELPRDSKLVDALAVAGGPTKRAALEAVCIFREGRVTDSEQVVLGHDNLFFTGKAEDNPPVEGQDIVYVPSTTKLEWDRIFSFLSGLKLIKDLFLR
jgi:polysaccharide export outer membrane protein